MPQHGHFHTFTNIAWIVCPNIISRTKSITISCLRWTTLTCSVLRSCSLAQRALWSCAACSCAAPVLLLLSCRAAVRFCSLSCSWASWSSARARAVAALSLSICKTARKPWEFHSKHTGSQSLPDAPRLQQSAQSVLFYSYFLPYRKLARIQIFINKMIHFNQLIVMYNFVVCLQNKILLSFMLNHKI